MNRKTAIALEPARGESLLYAGVALGLLAGVALSTYIWRQKTGASSEDSPIEKADRMIDACERKLERIERLMNELQERAG